MGSGRSDVYILKSVRERMEPCETPASGEKGVERTCLCLMRICLSVMKLHRSFLKMTGRLKLC